MQPPLTARPRYRRALAGAALLLAAALGGGCASGARALTVRLEPGPPAGAVRADRLDGYERAVPAIAGLLTRELALPLPEEFTVFVYPSRFAYAHGLARTGQMGPRRAEAIAGYSVALGQPRRLFINDAAFVGVPRASWLGVLAHELAHLAQYELSAGRRGTSEQWLREGMAEWVACWVLERLGEVTLAQERGEALLAVGQDLAALDRPALDLVDLGLPTGWEQRHLRAGDGLTYRLAFLLADELIRRHGFAQVAAYFRLFAAADDRFGNFRRVFGLSLEAFEADALRRLRREAGERVGPHAEPLSLLDPAR